MLIRVQYKYNLCKTRLKNILKESHREVLWETINAIDSAVLEGFFFMYSLEAAYFKRGSRA
jgi:hypothetical protein